MVTVGTLNTVPERPQRGLSSWLPFGPLFVVVAFVLGCTQGPLPLVGWDFSALPGDHIDNRFNHYVLEHGYRTIAAGRKGFWHAPMYHPVRWTVAGSENHLGTLPLYAGLRTLGAEPERAFQLWFVILSLLNYVAFVVAGRWFGLSVVASAVGGYLFAFGLPAVGQVSHVQMVPRLFVPIAVGLAWRAVRQPTPGVLGGCLAAVVAQLYCCMYLGLLTAGLLVGLAGVVLVFARRDVDVDAWCRPGRRGWVQRLLLGVALALPVAYLFAPYLRAARTNVAMPRDELLKLIPDTAAMIRPPADSAVWAWMRLAVTPPELAYDWEKQLFPGGVAVLAAVVGIWQVIRGSRGLAVFALLVVPVPIVFVDFHGWCLYQSLLDVPGVGKLRAIGRMILVLMVPFGVLVGWLVDRLLAAAPSYRRALAVGLLGLVAGDQFIAPTRWEQLRYPLAEAKTRREAWAAAVRAEANVRLIYVFPAPGTGPNDGQDRELDAMWASLETGIPTVNGYTGYPPKGWFKFPHHSDLLHWLRIQGGLTDDLPDRLLTFGRPHGADDSPQELAFRSRIRNRPIPGESP